MSEAQILFPMDPKEFWHKLKTIVEQVIIEHKEVHVATGEEKIRRRPLLKAGEVCAHLRISKPTLYEWMNTGKLPSVKIESRRYFKWEDVENLVEKNREASQTKL